MKRLLIMAMAMATMCMALFSTAQAQDTDYFVAYGEVNEEVMAQPENADLFSQHIAYMNKLYTDGHLAMAGPFDSGDSGLIILKAASMEEAKSLLMADPSIAAGLIKPVWFHGFQAFFNRLENRTVTVEQFNAMMGEGAGKHEGGSAHSAGSAGADTAAASGDGGMMDMTPGSIGFLMVPTTDAAASGAFYSSVFGWTYMPDPDHGMNFFTTPGNGMGEFSGEAKPAAPQSGVTFFINTASVKDTLPKVTAAGGQVVQPAMKLPEDWGHIAIITDPSGNAVGIWSAGE